jgi:hypothetical protein
MHVEEFRVALFAEAVDNELFVLEPVSLMTLTHRKAAAKPIDDRVIAAPNDLGRQRHLVRPSAIDSGLAQLALAPDRD